jgi:hypothetical protein
MSSLTCKKNPFCVEVERHVVPVYQGREKVEA